MSQAKGTSNRQLLMEEDLAIQDTLQMSVEDRVDLLANLLVEKIIEATS